MFGHTSTRNLKDVLIENNDLRRRLREQAMRQPGEAASQATTIHYSGAYEIDCLAEGMIVKRIFTRGSKAVNNWRVGYHQHLTSYYSPTLDGALREFFKNHPTQKAKYDQNLADRRLVSER